MNSPMFQSPKLNLPTVDTCRWRGPSLHGDASTCGLVSSLIGETPGLANEVSAAVCESCCNSFPPSMKRLNPVVASLVYQAASSVLAGDDLGKNEAQRAASALRLAEKHLPSNYPDTMKVVSAREEVSCFWWGAPKPAGGELHECHHPQHDLTTVERCRLCRDWSSERPKSRFLNLAEMLPPPDRTGPPVSRWAVGVTTAPRAEATLGCCLDSIIRAGWERPHLFLDGTMRIPPRYNHLPTVWREQAVGAWPAWYAALRELVQQQPDADAYMMLQDDVVLYDRESLRDYLARCLWPGTNAGIVSLYYARADPRVGWQTCHDAWHWSAQGFIFSPAVARSLLSDPQLMRLSLDAAPDRHIPIPTPLARWVNRSGLQVWFTNPSLAQHIGNVSTIWNEAAMTDGRKSSWYAGGVDAAFEDGESLASFPEHRFVCSDKDREKYEQRVERGQERMRRSTVVLCGLCRDVRLYLARTAARLERLGDMFRDYRIVIFENDSADATPEFLSDWADQNSRVDLLGGTMGVARHPRARSRSRARWMAACRNQCRRWINEHYAGFDHVIVFDADLTGGWSFDGIANTFGHDDWDMIGSYGLSTQRKTTPQGPLEHVDVWAFRPARHTAARRLINHNELKLRRGEPLLPVESCFGGLAVYRMECMRAASYGGWDCEHVVFHRRLRKSGCDRLFLNPSQIVMYSPMS